MSNIIYPFSLPIYQDFINPKSFNIIKEDTHNFISKNKNSFTTPWDCSTKSSIKFSNPQNINSSLLKSSIKSHMENYFKAWGWESSLNLDLSEIWINIAQKGDYQEEHIHLYSTFSGVIYINVNESSGNFHFLTPLLTGSLIMGLPSNLSDKYSITPKNGMILLFPSWLSHRVSQNMSNENRISISFNIQINN